MAAVIVIDGHRTRGEAVGLAVTLQADLELVATVQTVSDALVQIEQHRVDVAVLGQLSLAPLIPELLAASRAAPASAGALVPVVMLDPRDSIDDVRSAVEAGAMGLVAAEDSLDNLVGVARAAAAGRVVLSSATLLALLSAGPVAGRAAAHPIVPPLVDERAVQRARDRFGLTAREADVLQLLGEGLDAQTIARQLIMSVHTARGHLKSLMMKLNAHSQVELLVVAARQGLLPTLTGDGTTALASTSGR